MGTENRLVSKIKLHSSRDVTYDFGEPKRSNSSKKKTKFNNLLSHSMGQDNFLSRQDSGEKSAADESNHFKASDIYSTVGCNIYVQLNYSRHEIMIVL